jgi:orotate phosphoribosyltransferase
MHLLPSPDEVVRILRETGALRHGHFEYPNGAHSNEYLQVPIAMRHYQYAKILSVGLSRLLRGNAEIRPLIPELSVIAAGMGGLPVAHGVCEALQAKKVYWAEREQGTGVYRFRPFNEPAPGEQVMLVDDILHSGANLAAVKKTIESFGAMVIGLAVVVYQPTPRTHDFGALPLYYLARLEASYFANAASCDLCRSAQPVTKVWI